ncbi:Tigger transposable element-derived protein 4 [Gracilariopsis chorda]|uniref:Tigger transposable element-derived protein 4 n=1 Tax=Gracilariopsis chorda TaxID=448386 RepID=A0A2V3IQT3_9FLOR|nr:Tigger transposable element-derived protein 4 [Gracilariopsis chorda]|eukprot:PXF43510.1 Tigger transposable element-derived protein 4 [Gracilariopsis chorda]
MASLPTTSTKVRRKRLTLAEKRDILDDLSNGITVKEPAIRFGCTERTIQKTRAQSETVLAAFQQSASNTQFKALQAPRFPDIESVLYKFVQIARFAKLPLSGSVLRCRALHIHDVLLKKEHHDAKRLQLEAFSASAR